MKTVRSEKVVEASKLFDQWVEDLLSRRRTDTENMPAGLDF